MLIDRFGRRITNLRISITNRCNLSCYYCHREGYSSNDEMSVDEIKTIVSAFKKLGIKKVKITGGEPLMRRDVTDIISSMPRFDEISLTTNGIKLSKIAGELKEAGLSRVNVSLDTLNEEKYRAITRGGKLDRVLDGISEAVSMGLTPVKVNMVVIDNFNVEEVDNMIDFVSGYKHNVILQLIEVVGNNDNHYDLSLIEKKIKKEAKEVKVRAMHRRRQYILDKAIVEFVNPIDNSEFCMACNRIRVTADGKIKPCLMRNDNLVDIRGLKGEDLINAIRKAVMLREPYWSGCK